MFPYELAVEITGRSTVIMDCAVRYEGPWVCVVIMVVHVPIVFRSSKHLINHKKFVSPLLTVSPQVCVCAVLYFSCNTNMHDIECTCTCMYMYMLALHYTHLKI